MRGLESFTPAHLKRESFIRAGELAKAAGVSTDTLRHYERKGLLQRPRQAANGYRQYPPEALDRVLVVWRALAVGFTLDEPPARRLHLSGEQDDETDAWLRDQASDAA